ncbi:hypothetical protein [Paracidovorax valerianellae]|uniref:hypothetical protein n=1 Tax=Paracidovorax valerianellae TaxID=187868 RepID=UPI001113BF64|nr:hypothetical protein [Paracidovorax valerianellae]MDA8447473.1 hypothetical protein [Paracidovorax valerianellae]
MDLPEAITLDVPNLLTAAGVAVAILAALYSARSARSAHRQAEAAEATVAEAKVQSKLAEAALAETRRQNQIAGHGHRLDAYKALLAFRGKVTATGVGFEREAIWSLWDHVQVAEFYFSGTVAKQLSELVDAALANQAMNDELEESTNFTGSQRPEMVRKTHEHLWQLRELIDAADSSMRKEMRITRDED